MKLSRILPGISIVAIACTLTLPVSAQNATVSTGTSNSASAAPQASSPQANPDDASTYATGAPLAGQSKEGFWGKVNPFARKKWVGRQVQPIRDRENELDQLSKRNSNDIKDVDSRAQAGINKAMSAANAADQHAADASNRANTANTLASNASSRTDALNTTVTNLDQYSAIKSTDVPFAKGRTVLGPQGKSDLDDVATQIQGQKGLIVEVEAFSRGGIATSDAMADSVVRYLVTEHQVPLFRIYKVAMGKQTETASADSTETPLTNGVRVTLMHNSLADMGNQSSNATPNGQAGIAGVVQP